MVKKGKNGEKLSKWSKMVKIVKIKLLESPIPPAPTPSQKAHFDNISGTKRGSIDPLVSKRPEKNSE